MLNVNPYLNFPGTTEEAMNFYKSVFGGEFTAFARFSDSPGHEKMPKAEQNMIMHAALPLGNGHTLMATDALESMGQDLVTGNNYYINLATESEEETNRLFKGLSAGGKIEMPLNRTFWGAYAGMCRDRYGVQWMLNYDLSS
ncbi:MAG TPA: VOC family protein [Dinghuibacter sp.]|jgi:PhnB protein|uniref:VOC family protein n=1 Tax=Dinghuibacter sp. TaxID=2024697 RepID=UPI002B8471CE|nr:VOC family protein [Dinghuibacter sp.]HTJ12003.1 VOC family protein [Dinghuibacter sp.]